MTPLTRRQAIAAAAAAPVLLRATPAPAQETPGATGDAAVLQPVLHAELVAHVVYGEAAVGAGRRVRGIAQRFARHEAQHVRALGTAFEALGAPRPPAPEGEEALDAAVADLGLRPLGDARSPEALLRFLAELEEELVARWVRAHRGLQDTNLMQTATQALCCQAQHLVVLRQELGRPALAAAFEGAGR